MAFTVGCSATGGKPDAAAADGAVPMATSQPKNRGCVANCTNDYSICVTRGDGSTEDNAECEAEFRGCAAAC